MAGSFIGTSPDGSMFAFETWDWDKADKERERPIPVTDIWDSRLIVLPPPEPAATEQERRIQELFQGRRNRAHFEKRCAIQHPANDPLADRGEVERKYLFSPGSRYFASWKNNCPRDHPLEIFETQKGNRLVSFAAKNILDAGFAGDDAVFWLLQSGRLTAIEVATGRVLWETTRFGTIHYSAIADALLCRADEFAPLEILEARTGNLRA